MTIPIAMKIGQTILIFGIGMTWLGVAGAGESSCQSNAATEADRIACADQSLSQIRSEVLRTWESRLDAASPSERESLLLKEAHWRSAWLDPCTSRSCVAQAYMIRRFELSNIEQPAAPPTSDGLSTIQRALKENRFRPHSAARQCKARWARLLSADFQQIEPGPTITGFEDPQLDEWQPKCDGCRIPLLRFECEPRLVNVAELTEDIALDECKASIIGPPFKVYRIGEDRALLMSENLYGAVGGVNSKTSVSEVNFRRIGRNEPSFDSNPWEMEIYIPNDSRPKFYGAWEINGDIDAVFSDISFARIRVFTKSVSNSIQCDWTEIKGTAK
jgi:hypothetical protein